MSFLKNTLHCYTHRTNNVTAMDQLSYPYSYINAVQLLGEVRQLYSS